ncbi:MAG: 6-hydroxycyclohex-1-ene-1-carbonyl-CoA dehydrogenase [Polyangiaceae bacterium]|nr:6-hydroxycyclohex-1-ene-1-carbonyl-CoA dehydrogenase [Polyangiaceae bacterium]
MNTTARAWFLERPGQPLREADLALPDPGPGEAIVEVLACGMCHTDFAYASGTVAPNHALPLVLGHEVVGTVTRSGDQWLEGQVVIVPAVMPCGQCALCKMGRGNACNAQKMPGNDIHGGFASHIRVPSNALVVVPSAPEGVDVRMFGVVADAVSTAYQAIRRAGLGAGDVAFVVGTGGVGGYVVQIAHALGARVIACDVDAHRLALIARHGADEVVDVNGKGPKDIRKELHGMARSWGIPTHAYRIFECSGVARGQELAYALLARAATMVVVGYTMDTINVRLANLMAFDASVHGSWGCPPELYPEVLRMIFDGRIVLDPFVEFAPLSAVNSLLDAMAAHTLTKRMVLDPRVSSAASNT